MNTQIKAALMRALHTFWQSLASTIPAGIIITANMLKEADWKSVLLTVAGWLATALIASALSFAKSMAVGMPETNITPDTSLTWEQFKEDQGKITFTATEESEEDVS